VATLRKLLLTSVLAVTYPGTYDQMCIGMVIVLVFWRLESYAMPFFYHQVCFAMFAGLGLSRHAALNDWPLTDSIALSMPTGRCPFRIGEHQYDDHSDHNVGVPRR